MGKKVHNRLPEDILLCNDNPTKYAHLGWRCIIALLTWFILGKSITEGNVFFASIAIFVGPIMADYFKYIPNDPTRVIINCIAKCINGIFLIYAFLGLSDIIKIVKQDGQLFMITAADFIFPNFYIMEVKTFWLLLLLTVGICVVDWIVNKSPLEVSIIEGQKGV